MLTGASFTAATTTADWELAALKAVVPPASVTSAVPPAVPQADGDDLMFAADGEEAWW